VDELQGALLRLGSGAAKDGNIVIQQHRQRMNEWLATRLATARSDEERQILPQAGSLCRLTKALHSPIEREVADAAAPRPVPSHGSRKVYAAWFAAENGRRGRRRRIA
jgi:hypothetical protein